MVIEDKEKNTNEQWTVDADCSSNIFGNHESEHIISPSLNIVG